MKLYLSWLKTSIYHVREFFWPLFDKSEDDQSTEPEIDNEQEISIMNSRGKSRLTLPSRSKRTPEEIRAHRRSSRTQDKSL